MGSSSLVKSRKLYHTFRFSPVFGSGNSKMLLVKSSDRIHFKQFIIIKVARKNFYYHIPFLLFSQNVTSSFFCNKTFDVKLENLIDCTNNRKTFLFHVFQTGLIEAWNKIYFSSLIIHEKKILFYNISGAIHNNNISEILILFEYFWNL